MGLLSWLFGGGEALVGYTAEYEDGDEEGETEAEGVVTVRGSLSRGDVMAAVKDYEIGESGIVPDRITITSQIRL